MALGQRTVRLGLISNMYFFNHSCSILEILFYLAWPKILWRSSSVWALQSTGCLGAVWLIIFLHLFLWCTYKNLRNISFNLKSISHNHLSALANFLSPDFFKLFSVTNLTELFLQFIICFIKFLTSNDLLDLSLS